MVVGLVVGLLFLFLLLGMPVAFALGVSGMVGIYMTIGFEGMMGQLMTTPYRTVASVTLMAVPLFILMAELINQGGIGADLFRAANKWLGRLPGGVAIATIFASAGFGAISGSSAAAAGTMASISLPEFKKLGYGLPVATGVVAVAGTLAIMIPPSIPLIMYGIMTENSIGKLLIAGIIPGLLTAAIYTIGIMGWALWKPSLLPRGEKTSFMDKLRSLKGLWGFIVIVTLIVYALYGGIATTTEIAAFGAVFALLYLLVARRMTWAKFMAAMERTIRTSIMIFSIIIGAMLFGYFLTISQVPQTLVRLISESGLSPWFVFFLIIVIYLVLGFFMESISILIITLPITYPLIVNLGFDPIWFGIIVIKLIEIGLVTPPVGVNVYVVSGATGVPAEQVFKGTGFMLLFEMVSLLVLLLFPGLVTWLPDIMVG